MRIDLRFQVHKFRLQLNLPKLSFRLLIFVPFFQEFQCHRQNKTEKQSNRNQKQEKRGPNFILDHLLCHQTMCEYRQRECGPNDQQKYRNDIGKIVFNQQQFGQQHV